MRRPAPRRWPDDDRADFGETACTAIERHGGSVPAANGKSGYRFDQFRRTAGAAGGPALDLAGKQGSGPTAEELAARHGALHRRHQLSLPAPTGRNEDALAVEFGVGDPAPDRHLHRPNWDREIMVNSGPGTQSVPG